MRSKKKKEKKKIPPHSQHFTRNSVSTRPRPTRDGLRRNKFNAFRSNSPASVDARFVEIDQVRLSQTNDATSRQTVHRQIYSANTSLHASRNEEAFFSPPVGKKSGLLKEKSTTTISEKEEKN